MAVYSNRETQIEFDYFLPSSNQPFTAIVRHAYHMARSQYAEQTNIHLVPGIGWRLRSYHLDPGNVQELNNAPVMTASDLTIPSDFQFRDMWRKEASLMGVTYSADVQDNGSGFFVKRTAAGSTWNNRLDADQTAYPSPDTADDAADMDRVALGNTPIQPDESILFRVIVPASMTSASGPFTTLYFSGVAGDDGYHAGNGQYMVKLRGDGIGTLYEATGPTTRVKRWQFPWDTSTERGHKGKFLSLYIVSDAVKIDGKWQGTKIAITCYSMDTSPGDSFTETMAGIANMTVRGAFHKLPIYRIPKFTSPISTPVPVRVDMRRDIRGAIQLGKATYPLTGTLFDDVINLECPTNSDQKIWVTWKGVMDRPVPPAPGATHSNLIGHIYDVNTGAELTPTVDGSHTFSKGGSQVYDCPQGLRQIRVKIDFISDGTKTPILTDCWVFADPTYVYDSPLEPFYAYNRETAGSLPQSVISRVDIEGQQYDPHEETASFEIRDLAGILPKIRNRSKIPTRIKVLDSNTGLVTILASGYTTHVSSAIPRSDDNRSYPARDYNIAHCEMAGEWAALEEVYNPTFYTWTDPLNDFQFYKVTDICYALMASRYPDEMLDIPDIDIRPFGNDADSSSTMPGVPVLPTAMAFASDYLGAYWVFDGNAGTYGMWRLKERKTAPYTNLARFVWGSEVSGMIPSQADYYEVETIDGQEVPHVPIFEPYEEWTEPPEGNVVFVEGGSVGQDASNAAAGTAARFTQMAIKVDSFNPFNLSAGDPGYPDGTSDDYLGRFVPIRIRNAMLTTQESVDWVCRRVYDAACWERKYKKFRAPLVFVTVADDDKQVTPRPLQFYDPVEVQNRDTGDWEQWLVWRVNPQYTKDSVQTAEYVLVRQGNIDTIGVVPQKGNIFDLMNIVGKFNGESSAWYPTKQSQADNHVGKMQGDWASLPSVLTDPIQDLDPTSGTYGQFNWLMGYDEFI